MYHPNVLIKSTPSDYHVNAALTNITIGTSVLSERNLGVTNVFPRVPVMKKSDEYYVWERKDLHRIEARERAGGDRANIITPRLAPETYNCKIYALAERISDQQRGNQDPVFSNLDSIVSRRLYNQVLLAMEQRWINVNFTTGVWTGSTTGTDLVGAVDFTKFAAPSTGSPIATIAAEVDALTTLNVDPQNITLSVAPDVWTVFMQHDDFLDRLNQSSLQVLNEQLAAQILGIGKVVVLRAGHDANGEVATEVGAGGANANTFLASDAMLLTYAPATPSRDEPSAGYTFVWNGMPGAVNGGRVLRLRDDFHHSDHIEAELAAAPTVTGSVYGVFFNDCI